MKRLSILSLFGRFAGPFLVPVEIVSAAARGRGQGRPSGRRVPRLALDAAKPGCTLVAIRTTGKTPRAGRASVALIAIFSLSFLPISAFARQTGSSFSARPEPGSRITEVVSEAALRFGLPEAWIYAVMRQESGGRIDAVSAKGAMGLLQLMPATWRELALEFDLGDDPYDMRANVLAGSAYLRRMYDRFGSPGFLAAYNAGPQRYADYLAGAQSLPAETRAYVERLAPFVAGPRDGSRSVVVVDPRAAGLFVASGRVMNPPAAPAGEVGPGQGFWP